MYKKLKMGKLMSRPETERDKERAKGTDDKGVAGKEGKGGRGGIMGVEKTSWEKWGEGAGEER